MKPLVWNSNQNLLQIVYTTARRLQNKDLTWFLTELSHIQTIEVIKSTEISSAHIIRRGRKHYIEISKKFLENYVSTDIDLLFVVLHEISHKTAGDLHRNTQNMGEVYNLAMDWLINSRLYRLYFRNSPPPMLKKMYYKIPNLLCVLSPHCFIGKNVTISSVENYLRGCLKKLPLPLLKNLAKLYYKIWVETQNSNTEPSVESIVAWLLKCVKYYPINLNKLLGHHSLNGDGGYGKNQRSEKGGYGGKTLEFDVSIKPPTGECMEIYEAIRKALAPTPFHPILKQKLLPTESVVPVQLSRREAFYLSTGVYPVFFRNEVPREYLEDWSVRIYLDVSASISTSLPFLFGLLIHLKDEISEPIYCFSNQITELSFQNLRETEVKKIKYQSTGGTDFDCIAEHALDNKFKRILVITDGYARFNVKTLKSRLMENVETYVVLTRDRSTYFKTSEISEIIEVAGGEEKYKEKWWVITEETMRLIKNVKFGKRFLKKQVKKIL